MVENMIEKEARKKHRHLLDIIAPLPTPMNKNKWKGPQKR